MLFSNTRPCKVSCKGVCAGQGPESLEPRPELCPREESNLYCKLRKLASYPLNDEGGHLSPSHKNTYYRNIAHRSEKKTSTGTHHVSTEKYRRENSYHKQYNGSAGRHVEMV